MRHEARHRTGLFPALASFAPALACLFCPLCMTAGLGVLSALGVGVFVSEAVHVALIAASVVIAVGSAAVDSALPSQRTRIMKYLASSRSAFSSPVQVPS